jgi:NAD(P)-dependent dehydrogenase (short-subunit alcohol dehydrogenase family)
MSELSEQVAIVTGGASGIGAATVKILVEAGADALESGNAFNDIFGGPETKFSKTSHLASTVTQVQKIEKGRWVLVKEGLMF